MSIFLKYCAGMKVITTLTTSETAIAVIIFLLDLRKKTVIAADVAEIVQEVLKLAPAERTIVLRFVKKLSKADRSAQRKGRSV